METKRKINGNHKKLCQRETTTENIKENREGSRKEIYEEIKEENAWGYLLLLEALPGQLPLLAGN